VGLLALKQGDHVGAQLLFEESLIIASEGGQLSRISWCLTGLAVVAIEVAVGQDGHSETARAVRLLGAVDTIWNGYDGIISVADRQEYQDAVAASHNLLDEVSWEKAWSEGQALTMEQAVRLALQKPRER